MAETILSYLLAEESSNPHRGGVFCAVDSEDAANAAKAANAPNVASDVYFCIGEARRCWK